MSYLVLDYETNILRYKKRKASPFHPDNNALIVINKEFKKDVAVRFLPAYYRDFSTDPKQFTIGIKPGTTLLVGHNLKFDLLYSWHCLSYRTS